MRGKIGSIGLVLFLILSVFLGFTRLESDNAIAGNVWYVGSGPGNHSATINGGIGLASDGDTVYVHNGFYIENVLVDRTINLTGESRVGTVINGGGVDDIVRITADWVNVTGFTITNSGPFSDDNGIQIESNNTIISDNTISLIGGDGILLWYSSGSEVTDNVILNSRNGIHILSAGNNRIAGNDVSNSFEGIWLNESNLNIVSNNTLYQNDDFGIYLKSSNANIVVRNNAFTNFNGISLEESSTNVIKNNTCDSNGYGIRLWDSPFNHVIGNVASFNTDPFPGIGIEIWDAFIDESRNNIIENSVSNNIHGIRMLSVSGNNIKDNIISSNANYGIGGWENQRNNITGNVVNGNMDGIQLYIDSSENNIIGNNIFNNEHGLHINMSSNDNKVVANHISANDIGIHLSTVSKNNTILFNNITSNNEHGINIYQSRNNSVLDNNISDNLVGISAFKSSDDNLIMRNNIFSNNNYGMQLSSSSGNRIYHNNFIDNNNSISPQAYDDSVGGNFWNHTYYWNAPEPSGGNYWSDYSPTCQDLFDGAITPQSGGSPDSICDFEYTVDADSADYYPLTNTTIIEVPSVPQPPYINNLQVISTEVNITWNLSPSNNVNAYDIYGGPTQTSIDFSVPLYSTPDEGAPAAQWWAQFPFDFAGNPEYYFVVRARNNTILERSTTSNTAGYYTMNFNTGLNTFSLPLEPFMPLPLDGIMVQIGASGVSWLDGNDNWWTFPPIPAPFAQLGEGYVLNLSAPSSFVFTGQPASMIFYKDGFGFDSLTRNDIIAFVDPSGDVTVSWTSIPGAEYSVYWSAERDGFHTGMYTILNGGAPVAGPPFIHVGAASGPSENYYMVVPHDTVLSINGSSTYSIGVWTTRFNGNEMFGLPLKPVWNDKSTDWLLEQVPNAQGLVFLENGEWKSHFKYFPEGVYDTIIEFGRGYELSVYVTDRYSFIGW